MSFLSRPASFLRSTVLRPAASAIPRALPQVRFATQGYGSGAGNPAGEKPEKQGKNLSEHLEHPGPPPPKVARGQSSSSPNNDDQPGSSSSSRSSSSSSGKSSASGQAPVQQSQSNDGASKKGAQPKILNENPPSKENESEDVKKHNEDMENRAEKAHEQISNEDAKNDKVSKKFWAGQGGADREP